MTYEHSLLEREDEFAALNDALAAAGSGNGTFVCVEGPPGIGKSALLSAAAESVPGQHLLGQMAAGKPPHTPAVRFLRAGQVQGGSCQPKQ